MMNEMNAAGFEAVIAQRRTCRAYKNEPVSDEVMRRLYEAAASAPSSGGFQRIAIIEVRDDAKKAALAAMSRSQSFVAKAPVNLMFCIDGRRMRRIARSEGAPYSADCSIGALAMGLVDASVCAQTLVLAAEAEGLASCYNGNVTDMASDVSDLLELPEYVIPAFMLTLGYPASRGVRSKKYPPEVLVCRETYRDMDIDELRSYHEAKCGKPAFVVNDKRLSQLRAVLARQYDEAFVQRAVADTVRRGTLSAYQYWFGCYYPSNEKDVMDNAAYRAFLKRKGYDITE